jgi:hypothetical protein
MNDPLRDYEWPIQPGYEPFLSQKLVSSFMVTHPRSFVFSDTRTGKTRAALWACDWLMGQTLWQPIKALIVSDLVALEETWAHEILSHFLGRRFFAVVHGSAEQRVKTLKQDTDFYLINHEGLRIREVLEACLAKRDLRIAVFDEASAYRNTRTRLNQAAMKISRHVDFAWALTGTPRPRGAMDALGIKKIVHPDCPIRHWQWLNATSAKDPWSPFKRIERPDAVAKVNTLLSPAIRITQEQCFTPTEMMVKTLDAPLTDEQREWMRRLRRELLLMTSTGEPISAANQGALRAKLIQISCGAVYDDKHQAHEIDAAHRLKLYTTLVERIPGKIVTFAPLVSVVNMLHRTLGDGQSLKIDSDISREEKIIILREFQEGDKKVLISHPGPIARGIDLATANTIIWYAPTDRTEYYLQANERINGIKQKKPRFIIRLAGCSIEREIYERTELNASLMGLVLKLKEIEL